MSRTIAEAHCREEGLLVRTEALDHRRGIFRCAIPCPLTRREWPHDSNRWSRFISSAAVDARKERLATIALRKWRGRPQSSVPGEHAVGVIPVEEDEGPLLLARNRRNKPLLARPSRAASRIGRLPGWNECVLKPQVSEAPVTRPLPTPLVSALVSREWSKEREGGKITVTTCKPKYAPKQNVRPLAKCCTSCGPTEFRWWSKAWSWSSSHPLVPQTSGSVVTPSVVDELAVRAEALAHRRISTS